MPTYEYGCDACGHQFELFQPITAAAISTCAKCGQSTAQRIISGGVGLLFKGSGFYITDYRSNDYKQKAKSENAANSTDTAAAGPKADIATPKADATAPKTVSPAKDQPA